MIMKKIKNIAIIAFDSKKTDLIEWSYFNKAILAKHEVSAHGFAAKILEGTLNKKIIKPENSAHQAFRSIYTLINEGKIDALIIFGEATEISENKDLKAVLEKAIESNIIVATNKTTADFLLHSSLIESEYKIEIKEKKLFESELLVAPSETPLAKAS